VSVIVVMGVSGAGKSLIGSRIAERLGAAMIDADDYHTPENRAAMAAGRPLTDETRWDWLRAVGRAARDASAEGDVVVACSALRRSYRDLLREEIGPLRFLFLDGPPSLLEARLTARRGHFMPAGLLASQLATLEPPGADEPDATRIDLSPPAEAVVEAALAALAPGRPAP